MQYLQKLVVDYQNVSDFIKKDINGVSVVYLESLVNQDKINEYILKDIIRKKYIITLKNNISAPNMVKIENYEDLRLMLENGFTIVSNLFGTYAVETKGNLSRTITPPLTEPTLYGPKESLVENFQINLGLIKRRIKSDNLKNVNSYIGRYTKTLTSVLYIKGVTDTNLLKDVLEILRSIDIDGICDIGELKKYLIHESRNVLPSIKITERPDLITRSLLNGKIVIIMDNSPFALILPSFLGDFINPIADQYCNKYNINFIKILRFFCFFLSIMTPAIYIALTTFNQEALPTSLLISIQNQRLDVPFPAFLECLITLITCEILRESDLRFPSNYGSAISILGALVLGDAAVSAGIVSPIMIIVVAITFISSLIFTDLEMVNGLRNIRFIFLIFGSIFGIYGVLICFIMLIIYLVSFEPFNVPYTYPISPFDKTYIAETLFKMKNTKRSKLLSKNRIKENL